VVTAQDGNGVTDTDFSETVTLSLASGSGSISNNTTTASNGVATFAGLAYTATSDGESFALQADDEDGVGSNLSAVNANTVTAVAGAAAQLSLSFDASDIVADGSSTKQITVLVKDSFGVLRTNDNSTQVTLTVTGSATGGGTLTVSGGSATFSVTSTTSPGTVTLSATASGASAGSGQFSTSNSSPVAVAQSVTTAEDTDVILTLSGTDADGDALSAIIASLPSSGSLFQTSDGATRGTAISTVPASVSNSNNQVIFAPAAHANGTANFSFQMNDGKVTSTAVSVTVTVTSVQDAPNAIADQASTDEDVSVHIEVLKNDFDVDGDALALVGAGNPSNGSATIQNGRFIIYAPEDNFNGTDSFNYTISDGQGHTATAIVTVAINSIDDSPLTGDDTAVTLQDHSVSIDVLANDRDLDSEIVLAGVGGAQNGLAEIQGVVVLYTPASGFFGTDQFTYTVRDAGGNTATGGG
jgi:hypothetical protein